MGWQDRIRKKALTWLSATGTITDIGPGVGWPIAYPAGGAQVFWPNWPDQAGAVPLNQRVDLVNSSLLMAAVNWLGTQIAEPPPEVEQQQPDGDFECVPDHPMLDVLARPNPYMTGELLLKTFAYSWVVYGNVFWYKARDERTGQVKELWPLDASRVRVWTDLLTEEYITNYQWIAVNGTEHVAPPSDIVHFRCGLDPRDQRVGLAPVESLWQELLADSAVTGYTTAMLNNFGVPPYIITPEPDPTGLYTVKSDVIKNEILNATTGTNAGKMLMFERPMKVHVMGVSPDQMSIDKARRLPEERVAAVLNIPGVLLGYGSALDRSTYNNMATARKLGWEQAVVPLLKSIAANLREQLLPEFLLPSDNPEDFWVDFDYSNVGALQEDQNLLYKRTSEAYRFGILKRSEARTALGQQSDPTDEVYSPMAAGAGGGAGMTGFGTAGYEPDEIKALGHPVPDDAEWREIEKWYAKVAPVDAQGALNARTINGQ